MLDTYVHNDVDTYVVETSTGTVTSTAEHPFWVDGRGWTPVRDLQPGDKLVDAEGVRVELVAVTATGETATVHNVNVEHLHNYHVRAGDHSVLVHNTCRTDTELHAFGNALGPRPPRAGVDFEVGDDGLVVPQSGPTPRGASTFADPSQGGLSGVHHSIPAGTEMPAGSAWWRTAPTWFPPPATRPPTTPSTRRRQ